MLSPLRADTRHFPSSRLTSGQCVFFKNIDPQKSVTEAHSRTQVIANFPHPTPPRRHLRARPRPAVTDNMAAADARAKPSPLPLGKTNVREPLPAQRTLRRGSHRKSQRRPRQSLEDERTTFLQLGEGSGRRRRKDHRARDCGRPTSLWGSFTGVLKAQKGVPTSSPLLPASYRLGQRVQA